MESSSFTSKILKILYSRLFIGLLLIVVVPALIYILTISFKKSAVIIPNKDFKHFFYDDRNVGGHSVIIKETSNNNNIAFDFKLDDSYGAPFAGITIYSDSTAFGHLSGYNQIEITVACKHLDKAGLALYIPNPTPGSDEMSRSIPFYKVFPVSDKPTSYSFLLDEFSIPSWWSEMNAYPSDISLTSNNILNINIANGFSKKTDQTQSIEVHSLKFSRNISSDLKQISLFCLVYLLILFLIFYLTELIKGNKNAVTISYKPLLNSSTTNDTIENSFIHYINENFNNPDLSLEMVANETISSQRKITNYIQDHYSCNFKTYINRLRINESKRLLLETDLSIGEIAFKVGFNNQSHFNRVFKTEMNDSPTNFRSKK